MGPFLTIESKSRRRGIYAATARIEHNPATASAGRPGSYGILLFAFHILPPARPQALGRDPIKTWIAHLDNPPAGPYRTGLSNLLAGVIQW